LAITTYYTDAQSVFTAFTTPPVTARKTLINANIGCLKTASLWATLDAYQVYAAADSQAATADWKVPSRIATLTNAPTFTIDRGYLTNGTNSIVDTLTCSQLEPHHSNQVFWHKRHWTKTGLAAARRRLRLAS
jgi:hypothetical protein